MKITAILSALLLMGSLAFAAPAQKAVKNAPAKSTLVAQNGMKKAKKASKHHKKSMKKRLHKKKNKGATK